MANKILLQMKYARVIMGLAKNQTSPRYGHLNCSIIPTPTST